MAKTTWEMMYNVAVVVAVFHTVFACFYRPLFVSYEFVSSFLSIHGAATYSLAAQNCINTKNNIYMKTSGFSASVSFFAIYYYWAQRLVVRLFFQLVRCNLSN